MNKRKSQLRRFWVSWWSGNYTDEGCTAPPFQCWLSGEKDRGTFDEVDPRTDQSICAVIDALNEDFVWQGVRLHFPDLVIRFCNEVERDWQPNDRFPDFKNKTRLGVQS